MELEKARKFVEENRGRADPAKRDRYHFSPAVGWMNDPNGFSYFGGSFHLFYQYYPYDTRWGRMHWGHAVSEDLIRWDEQPVAMAPSEAYDGAWGCFSGSVALKGAEAFAIYTGVGAGDVQTQCLAHWNGDRFEKYAGNPVIPSSLLPSGCDIRNFRDPYVVFHKGSYYMLVGAKKENNDAAILLYRSGDLLRWEFVNELYVRKDTDGMLECPSIGFFGDEAVIFFSPQEQRAPEIYNNQNPCSVMYVSGSIDFETGTFHAEEGPYELDKGSDYYALQVLNYEGKVYGIAWMNLWGNPYPFEEEGYAGKMTTVKEFLLDKGIIYQKYPDALLKYVERRLCFHGIDCRKGYALSLPSPSLVEMTFGAGDVTFSLKQDAHEELIARFDATERLLCVSLKDGSGGWKKRYAHIFEDRLCVSVLVDICSAELLLDRGRTSMSFNSFVKFSEAELSVQSQARLEATLQVLKR